MPVGKYRSLHTGLVVYIAQVEGPLVNGYFCLATEAHDHDGLPHTLEHLIFMGSEQYPFKGVLDLLANRCLAQGTNAWTDVDHTCYTMTMAGSEGFLNLLPIYLDHILYPTLTDSAYLTEVHHVNGKGEDAGVVYCEMQARENTSHDRTHFALCQQLYPGHCGYKSETGGRLENLRTSCSNLKVRDYHKCFYRPDNLCLIVTGQVTPEELFQSIAPFEERITSKGPLPSLPRPWQSEVPGLTGPSTDQIQFPTDEEDDGLARIAWRGPSALDRYSFAAMACLMEYLAETSVAPLQKELVEIEEPFCCEIEQLVMENAESCFGFTFSGCPVGKISGLCERVGQVMSELGSGSRELEMGRMKTIVKNQMLQILNQAEETPHYFFAFAIIGDFLFAKSPDQFAAFIDHLPRFKQLLKEPASFWVALVDKYFVKGHRIVVLGCPSSELSKSMVAVETERVEDQAKHLGEAGLKGKTEALEMAIAQNEIAASKDIISQVPVPGTSSIHFHPCVAMGNHQPLEAVQGLPEYGKFPVHEAPFFMQVHHIHSMFVELTVLLDTSVLPRELLLYLPLYLEVLYESPILRGDELVPYERVVNELEADTISSSADLGHCGGRFSPGTFSQAAFINIKVEAKKYALGVRWVKEVLYGVQFTKERLLVVANKMINDVSSFKRKGSHVAKTLMWHQLYSKHANLNVSSMLTQLSFLTLLVARLKEAPEEVIASLNSVRETLTGQGNLRVFVATNVLALPHSQPLEPWKAFPLQSSPVAPSSLPPVAPLREFLSPAPLHTRIAGVGGVDSNYLVQTCPCVTSHLHSDLPAIVVLIEYLCALEGPLWRQVRGMGLSYNYRMMCRPDNGHLYFQLFKSSQLVQAYKVSKEIVHGYLSGSTPFEQLSLEAAISGVIFEFIDREKTVALAADQAVLNYLRHLEPGHSKRFLANVAQVTLDDLSNVGKRYFSKLFDPLQAITAVCCSPGKVQEVKSGLEGLGHEVIVVEDMAELAVN